MPNRLIRLSGEPGHTTEAQPPPRGVLWYRLKVEACTVIYLLAKLVPTHSVTYP